MAIRGGRVALLAGTLIAFALGCSTLERPPPDEVRAYMARLRDDRELLLDLVTAAPASPEHQAVREFVHTPEGKDRLLDLYLEVVFASDDDFTKAIDSVRTHRSGAWMLLWVQDSEVRGRKHWNVTRGGVLSSSRSVGFGRLIEDESVCERQLVLLLTALQDLLFEVGYDRYPLPGAADLTFSVAVRKGEEKRILGTSMSWDWWTEGRVALIERAGRFRPRIVE